MLIPFLSFLIGISCGIEHYQYFLMTFSSVITRPPILISFPFTRTQTWDMPDYSSEEAALILQPYLIEYPRLWNENDSVSLSQLYSPNATLVEKDKRGVYGRSGGCTVEEGGDRLLAEIEKAVRPFLGTLKAWNMSFSGAGELIRFKSEYECKHLSGMIYKGNFIQIFRKEGDKWFIVHDEFHHNPID